jgi:hypothetical protein
MTYISSNIRLVPFCTNNDLARSGGKYSGVVSWRLSSERKSMNLQFIHRHGKGKRIAQYRARSAYEENCPQKQIIRPSPNN